MKLSQDTKQSKHPQKTGFFIRQKIRRGLKIFTPKIAQKKKREILDIESLSLTNVQIAPKKKVKLLCFRFPEFPSSDVARFSLVSTLMLLFKRVSQFSYR